MTTAKLGSLNIASLTSLVNTVLAQGADDTPAPGFGFKKDDEGNPVMQDGVIVPGHWVEDSDNPGTYLDPNAEAEAEDEDREPKFSTDAPYEHQVAQEWVKSLGFSQIGAALASDYVNRWGLELYRENGAFPSARDLIENGDFFNGAVGLALQLSDNPPPPVFWFRDDDEISLATMDPLKGLQFAPRTVDFASFTDIDAVNAGEETPTTVTFDASQGPIPASEMPVEERPTFEPRIDRIIDNLDPELQGAIRGTVSGPTLGGVDTTSTIAPTYPTLTGPDLAAILNPAPPAGGGGRVGRQQLAFDRDMLVEEAADKWSRWLIEPADEDKVGPIVDKYIQEAQAFWMAEGGRKDFDTFLTNELRTRPRYSVVMKWKPDDVDEDAFIQSYGRYTSGFGLAPQQERGELFRSVTSGGSVEGQTQRLLNTRTVSQRPQFAKRFAQTLSGLGAGVTEF